jgi:predicted NAD-dependent protein-ADP-ribosyltransferase YbiA (DUF1768 family)
MKNILNGIKGQTALKTNELQHCTEAFLPRAHRKRWRAESTPTAVQPTGRQVPVSDEWESLKETVEEIFEEIMWKFFTLKDLKKPARSSAHLSSQLQQEEENRRIMVQASLSK